MESFSSTVETIYTDFETKCPGENMNSIVAALKNTETEAHSKMDIRKNRDKLNSNGANLQDLIN